MELLILGDSLPFGRPKYGICRDKTWPYILARELNSSLSMRARGDSTVYNVMAEVNSLDGYWFDGFPSRKFDAAFVQVGIVDACPRLIHRKLYPLATRLPGFKFLVRWPPIYKTIGNPWVANKQFTQAIHNLHSVLTGLAKQVFFIEIAMPSHHLLQNVGDFSDEIKSRNFNIRESVGKESFVEPWGGVPVPHFLLPDGVHLNIKGHLEVSMQCIKLLL